MIKAEQCLDNASFEKMLPLGMTVKVLERIMLEGEQFETLTLSLEHYKARKYTTIELTIPVFNGNVIQWRNSKKALMFVGNILIDSDFDIAMFKKEGSEYMDLSIVPPSTVAIRGIENQLSHALRNWFYDIDTEIDNNLVQIHVDRFFSTGDNWRVLKYSAIAQEDQHNGILIAGNINSPSHVNRMLSKVFNPKLWGTICLNSTSFSDKANESFRLTEGVKCVNGKLINEEGKLPVCSILKRHSIFLEHNPARAYLLRNTIESAIELIKPELPIVSPYESNETNPLHGINFLTAIMHLGIHTHEDAIAISESAAKKMWASRIMTQLIESDAPVTPLLAPGDAVSPDSIIALDGDKEVTASKLYMPGIIEERSISKGKRFGESTQRVWYKIRSFYPLETGDKISNRHGGKGVVKIIPDSEMPVDVNGNVIEICIGPESIINRKAMSIFWEMMLCKKAQYDGMDKIKVTGAFEGTKNTDYNSFSQLAGLFGTKDVLYLNGEVLPESTYVSKLFWMRIDKIAKEIVSCVKTKRSKNNFGAVVDSAKISGQRCNLAKILALSGRDAIDLAADIIDNNMSGQKFFKQLVDCARNERFVINGQKS